MSQLGIYELYNELSSLIHMSKEILDSNSTLERFYLYVLQLSNLNPISNSKLFNYFRNLVNKNVKEKIQALDEAFYLDSELCTF